MAQIFSAINNPQTSSCIENYYYQFSKHILLYFTSVFANIILNIAMKTLHIILLILITFHTTLVADELVLGLESAMQKDADHVTQLCLGGSSLSDLPDFFCELTELIYLNMAQNELRDLPTCFANFDKLKELNLSANYLQDISALKGMKSLNILDISLNESLDIDDLDNLSNLEQLIHLDLSYLNLNHLPQSIYLLKNLKELILTGNTIAKKDLDILKQNNRNLHIII